MAYAGITAAGFRNKSGTLSEKIAVESAAIKAETDSLDTALAAGLKVAKITVTGGLANVISFAWQNPESSKILILKAVLRVEEPSATATAAVNIGVAANGTTGSDTIIDGCLVTTAGLFDNVTNAGTNGLPQVVVDERGGTDDYVTCQIVTANAAALSGKVYLLYTVI
jgi:hypothetical protein